MKTIKLSSSKESLKKIISEFQITGQYSTEFLKDLKEGLKNSSCFRPKKHR